MGRRLSITVRSLTVLAHITACIASLAVLLLLPAARAHSFPTHFRTPEVCRSAQRHLPIAHSDTDNTECVAQIALLPVSFAPIEPVHCLIASPIEESSIEVPRARLVRRMKVTSARSNSQDPLLKA
jgi:hypothetical protein